jgi:hypothetical protein
VTSVGVKEEKGLKNLKQLKLAASRRENLYPEIRRMPNRIQRQNLELPFPRMTFQTRTGLDQASPSTTALTLNKIRPSR